jgi:hypothetical protein
MPKVLDSGTWWDVSDVISKNDGTVMSFKINTKEHGVVKCYPLSRPKLPQIKIECG